MASHSASILQFPPWGIAIVLFLAFVCAVLGVFIYFKATGVEKDFLEKKFIPLQKACVNFFSRFGLFPTNPLNQSFERAVEALRHFIGGREYRYRLPWILMLGGTNTGKTTLLKSLDLDHPFEISADIENQYEKPLCNWLFYDHGVVLDLEGKLVINADKVGSEESLWDLFLNLLVHYRPKRALDGIVLTIPASEISGKTALSHDDIILRANYIYDKLWQMQRITGFRIPVYVVVTKCDLLPGFESFCKALPFQAKADIFGWSNDKAIDSVYTADWVGEAFTSLNASLSRLQQEIYAEGETIDHQDGVFLFPLAFDQLKEGIQTYANSLFKPSSYHESFFLRGIYFVGDSHIEAATSEVSSSLEVPWIFEEDREIEDRNLFFIKDLFEKKVFREVGLARPVSRRLLGNTTAIRFGKVALAAIVVASTVALLRVSDHLQNARTSLMSVLPQIDLTLEKIRGQNEGTDIGRLYFDQQAQTLLNAVTQINNTSVFSFGIPASWFSRLNSKIHQIMILVYDKVILRSMGSQLNYKARQLVSLEVSTKRQNTESVGVDPLKTPEFQKLQNFVLDLQSLETAANTFNALGEKSSLQSVANIIKYLFNYDMPPSFFSNGEYYLATLEQARIQPFNFHTYEEEAAAKLNRLFEEFRRTVFNPNKIIPGLATLSTALYEFAGARNYAAYDASVLRDVYLGLDETLRSIESPGFLWIDGAHFHPGAAYANLLPLIAESNFLPDGIAETIASAVDQDFLNFRKRLAGYSSSLFEGETLFMTENGLAVAIPSQGALILANNLKAFFSETFMAPSQNKSIITTIPVGAILLWDTLRLQQAMDLISSFNEFVDSRLLNMPKALQPLLQKIAQETLGKNLVDFVANAEVFSAQEPLRGRATFSEDILLPQVQNYRVAAPYLEQILLTLRANNIMTAFSTLRVLLTAQAYIPLMRLDTILIAEAPYALKDDSFGWWKGKKMAALEAFEVSNITELRHYLELQRERLAYLSQEFASPLVSFLEKINQEGMPGDLPLIEKWKGIEVALKDHGRKALGNSLVALENFVLTSLNDVTLKTCADYTHNTDRLSGTHDFFLETFANIEERLRDRCEGLAGQVSLCTYRELSTFFNTHLAGRFPFAKESETLAPDANPDDVRMFFQIMEGQAEGLKAALSHATGLGPSKRSALDFITQMDKIKDLFGGFLATSDPLQAPAFVFDIDFRVNREEESHGNEVLEWEVISHDTLISMRSPSRKGYWSLGDPVKVIFRWAANSPLQPLGRANDPYFEVQGGNAIYSYNGLWALLRLLRQHQTASSYIQEVPGKRPSILQFIIPLRRAAGGSEKIGSCSPQGKVFLKISLSPVTAPINPKSIPSGDTSECATGEAIRVKMQEKLPMGNQMELPHFPVRAPEL